MRSTRRTRSAWIQQDVELPPGVVEIELVRGGHVLDTFRPEGPFDVGAAAMSLGPPRSGRGSRRDFGASDVEPQRGVSYQIQARADNDAEWRTLSIGRPTPEFQIDRNQFPGAKSVAVRMIQNAGFSRRTVDERTIPLK